MTQEILIDRSNNNVVYKSVCAFIGSPPEEIQLFDLLFYLKIVHTKAEAKRLIQGGGIKINGEKITKVDEKINITKNIEFIIQVGKSNLVKLIVGD